MQKKGLAKLIKKAAVIGMAGILALGNAGVMKVQADDGFIVPEFDAATGKYTYDVNDVFGAATHVHLFGNHVETSAHTHGNVMAETADFDEIGMRDGKVSYPAHYTEYSYVGDQVSDVSVTVHNKLIIGADMSYDEQNRTITNADATVVSAHTYSKGVQPSTVTPAVDAVDVQGTLAQMKLLSKNWATNTQNAGVASFDLVSDQNKRIIQTNQTSLADPNQNIYVNIPLADWESSGNYIQIQGLDSDSSHSGIVVLNINLAGQTDVDLSCGDMKVYDAKGNMFNNTEHTSAAFGTCRVVYNLYDSTQGDYVYTGKVTFTGTCFGTILAPGADVTVGAINGNVIANRINHVNQESHRMDICPLYSAVTTSIVEKDEIRLLLELQDQSTVPGANGVSSETTYTLYSDEACTQAVTNITPVTAVWNKSENKYELIISSTDVTNKLAVNTAYYLKKTDVNDEYTDNGAVFEAYVTDSGSIEYRKMVEGSTITDRTANVLTDVLVKNSSTGNPEGGDPGTNNPEGGDPGTNNPEGGDPGTSNPEGGDPGTNNPEGGDPGTSNPEGGDPGTSNPEGGDPGTSNPEGGDPGTNNPEEVDPGQDSEDDEDDSDDDDDSDDEDDSDDDDDDEDDEDDEDEDEESVSEDDEEGGTNNHKERDENGDTTSNNPPTNHPVTNNSSTSTTDANGTNANNTSSNKTGTNNATTNSATASNAATNSMASPKTGEINILYVYIGFVALFTTVFGVCTVACKRKQK